MKAMIFAAGLGTRLAPLTNDRPKALVELRGKTLLWHVAERLANEGFRDITVNVHHFAQQIKDYIQSGPFAEWAADNRVHFNISDESALLLDTGGGLRKAAPLLFGKDDAPVLIHNVDIMSTAHFILLYDAAVDNGQSMLLVSKRQTSRYLLFDDDMRLVGWQNIKTGEVRTPYPDLQPDECRRLAFSGIQVVNKQLVDSMADWPPRFSIIDFYIANCRTLDIRGYEQPSLQLADLGKIEVFERFEV